ncbi:MAG: 4-hydroxy-tetrahydrodipicolinate reductase [Actinomycetaceae bacterium]|nr:4-hydroxy-tetrahydrodipicolinate reductase [Arcanobacterium sp.]MDD7504531.1 4-hydroxy-tetrahydrodipicolinate reductase [Actinomycetaceae bacterium]MDY6142800.1 4-hydroxy-tetrahydrodipicolinate reductase [Arcanobacterium sp.]
MIRVAVIGSNGRMGSAICEAVDRAEDLSLVARLDAGDAITSSSLNRADVAIEFTIPDASEANVNAAIDAGVHVVVGTTGWTRDALERVETRASQANVGVIVAPNYSLSAVLAMRFAEQAAALFESVEVIELHHPDKLDAPSGTAISTAQRIAAARKARGVAPSPDATQADPDGARGAVIDGVHVHGVRLRGLYAHEEILLGNTGEQLTIRQDSFDRASFMPGVLLAARQVAQHPGLTYGLEHYLNLD